jgi:ADP-ribosylglycohydrolase
MALILWEYYDTYGTIKEEKLFDAYARWAKEEGSEDGIGIHTAAVLLRGERDKSSQGNGALMRVLPFGLRLIEEGMPLEKAVALVNQDAAITHDNETVRISNRLCLDVTVNGLDVLQKSIYAKLLSQVRSGHSAWVLHTLYTVLDVLMMELPITEGFKELVSRGGDTDTNCAIYGAIRGYTETLDLVLDDYLDDVSLRMLERVLSD